MAIRHYDPRPGDLDEAATVANDRDEERTLRATSDDRCWTTRVAGVRRDVDDVPSPAECP